MRNLLAELFKLLFKIPFFKKRYFGIYTRIIKPLNLFKGVSKKIMFKPEIWIELEIEDWIAQNIYLLGNYEKEELMFLEHHLKPDDTFIDIGANIGIYTLLAAKLVEANGTVISFEPFEKNHAQLLKNIALNGFKNIRAEKKAIDSTSDWMTIFYDPKEANKGMASAYQTGLSEKEKVETISLDQYLNEKEINKVDWIKIDIEGGEYPALLGMKETLQKYKPQIIIELDPEIIAKTPYTNELISNFLIDLGYRKYFLNSIGQPVDEETEIESFNTIFIYQT